MSHACPQCGDTGTQRTPLAYEGGLSHVNTNTGGLIFNLNGGGIGLAAAKTRGTQQTALSQRVAPPSKQGYKGAALLFLVGLIGTPFVVEALNGLRNDLLSSLVLTCGLGATMFYTWRIAKHVFHFNRVTWPDLYAHWQRSFFCHKCGNVFTPGD
jgi:hypothetical protein